MKKLVALCALFLGLVGCGPEESNLDKETEQMDQLYQKTREVLATLAGNYEGTITGADNRKIKAFMKLRSFSEFLPSPNRLELIEVPKLLAFVTFEGTGIPTINFSQGNFDRRTSTLKLYGSSEVNGVFYFMQVKVDGKQLAGEFLRDRLTSQAEFIKISDAD